MSDILIRKSGHAGHITLNRPKALNALTWDMCLAIETALDTWAQDDTVKLLVIDGAGDRAFCAGGDIAEMYASGMRGDYDYGRRFWRDEYRMNAKLFEFPKPVVSFLQGFTMGGGVGVGCHGSHRIVGDSSRIAMPEVGIGLVPDVGGSLLLARAPGRLGEYLGVTGARMGPGDAIHAGFADYYIPEENWQKVKTVLFDTADWTTVDKMAAAAPAAPLADLQPEIDAAFAGETFGDILRALQHSGTEFAESTLEHVSRNSPLSMYCAILLIHRTRSRDTIRGALELEYRFTHRAMEQADFLEGIRAAIIDKDRTPKWRHDLDFVPNSEVTALLMPLGDDTLCFTKGPS